MVEYDIWLSVILFKKNIIRRSWNMEMELYYFEACPYCRKVLRFLEKREHTIILKDTARDPECKQALCRINNENTQVPCLVVEGKPMLESGDIIKYLKTVL